MRKLLCGVAMCVVMVTANVGVARADKAQLIEDLFKIMNYDKLLHSQTETFSQGALPSLLTMMRCSYPQFNQNDDAEITRIFFDSFGINEIRKFTVSLYAKHFTEEELKQLVEFYSSPVGKRMVELTPKITEESVAFGLKQGERAVQRVQDSVRAYIQKKGYQTVSDQTQLQSCINKFLGQTGAQQ